MMIEIIRFLSGSIAILGLICVLVLIPTAMYCLYRVLEEGIKGEE